MEYIILLHQGVKPHFIIARNIKDRVKIDLLDRGYSFIKDTKVNIDNTGIILDFGNEGCVGQELKGIKNTPFKYYMEEFDALRKAVNKSFNTGDRGGYCKLISNAYAFCISGEMLFSIRDHVIAEERSLGNVEPYEEADEGTELNW